MLFLLTKNCLTSFSRSVLARPIPGEEVWSRTDTESLGASGAEDEDCSVAESGGSGIGIGIGMGVKKTSGWRTIRQLVRFTPFMNTFRKRHYPWVQVPAVSYNFISNNACFSWLGIKTASCVGLEEMGLF